jgi:hypothetical protein
VRAGDPAAKAVIAAIGAGEISAGASASRRQ